jgi:hypothetical protein
MRAYPDFGHPEGIDARPWYRLQGNQWFPDFGHPEGIDAPPWFSMRLIRFGGQVS